LQENFGLASDHGCSKAVPRPEKKNSRLLNSWTIRRNETERSDCHVSTQNMAFKTPENTNAPAALAECFWWW